MIFDITIIIVLGCHRPHPYKTMNLIDVCVFMLCVFWVLQWSAIPLSPSLSLSHPVRHNIEVRPVNDPAVASKYSGERKSQVSHYKSKARNDSA